MKFLKPLSDAAVALKKGAYQHYKGNLYTVLYVAHCSETLEELVIYQDTATQQLWVRPLTMFIENVSDNNQIKPRFTYLEKIY